MEGGNLNTKSESMGLNIGQQDISKKMKKEEPVRLLCSLRVSQHEIAEDIDRAYPPKDQKRNSRAKSLKPAFRQSRHEPPAPPQILNFPRLTYAPRPRLHRRQTSVCVHHRQLQQPCPNATQRRSSPSGATSRKAASPTAASTLQLQASPRTPYAASSPCVAERNSSLRGSCFC